MDANAASENISVAVRIRGRLDCEQQRPALWLAEEESNRIVGQDKLSGRTYVFDRVFGPEASNDDVYDGLLASKISSVTQGFNATIFAYGQTASGKTHTMLGDSEQPGIMPLAVIDIFRQILDTQEDKQWIIRASYVEIYNETLVDLLVDPTQRRPLGIQEDKKGEGVINGLTEISVTTVEEVCCLVEQGERHRSYGETDMNERSSRSHTIFRLIVESLIVERVSNDNSDAVRCGNAITVGRLNLVDLAGSERASQSGAVGDRLREGGTINKSLLALGQVIAKLSEGAKEHIPYRTSKLTRILKHSLGGNSKTAIICTVSPVEREQTKSTLDFAIRAKTISTRSFKNEILDDTAHLATLRREIVKLNDALKEERESKLKWTQELSDALKEERESKLKSTQELEEKVHKLQNQMLFSFGTAQPISVQEKKLTRENRRKSWHPNLMQARKSTAFDLKPLPADVVRKLSTISEYAHSESDESPQNSPQHSESQSTATVGANEPQQLRQCEGRQRLSAIAEEETSYNEESNVDGGAKLEPQEVEILLKEIDFLRAKIGNVCCEADSLKQELKESYDRQEHNTLIQQTLNDKDRELQQLQEETSFALQEAKLLREELSVVRSETIATLERDLACKQRESEALARRLQREEEQNDVLRGQLETAEKENSFLSSAIAVNEHKNNHLKQNAKELKEVVMGMKNDMETKENEIEQLRESLIQKEMIIEAKEKDISAMKSSGDLLVLQDQMSEIEDLRAMLKEAEAKNALHIDSSTLLRQLESEVAKKDDELRQVKALLQQKDESREKRERELIDYSTTKAEEAKHLEEKLAHMNSLLEEKESKNRKLVRFQKDIKETIFGMKKDLDMKNQEIENLRVSIDQMSQHGGKTLQEQNIELEEKYSQLQEDFRSLQGRFDALGVEYDEMVKEKVFSQKLQRELEIKKLELTQEREEVNRLKSHLRRFQSNNNMDTSLMPRKKSSASSLKSLPTAPVVNERDTIGDKKNASVSTENISHHQEATKQSNQDAVFRNVEWTSGSAVSKEAFLQIFARKNRKLESKLAEVEAERDSLRLQVDQLKSEKAPVSNEKVNLSDVENSPPKAAKSAKSASKKRGRPSFAWLNNALRTPLRERNKTSTSSTASSSKESREKEQKGEEDDLSSPFTFPKNDLNQFY